MITLLRILVVLVILTVLPVWLYASGNLPYYSSCNEYIVARNNIKHPVIAKCTYNVSHYGWEKLRDNGVEVPQTQVEKLIRIDRPIEEHFKQQIRIIELRCKIDAICNDIVNDRIAKKDDDDG